MLSTKNYNNNSSIYATTAKFNKLEVDTINIGNFTEIGLIPGVGYVLDYNISNKFYIKTYDVGLIGYNYSLIIKNVPTDFNIYTLTLLTYNFYPIYCNLLKVIDTEGNYILGSDTAYETPFFSNGIPILNAGPCIIIQEFSIVPIFREYSLTPIKYVLSNIKSNYTTANDIYNIFYTKTEIDTLFNNYPTISYVDSSIQNVYDTVSSTYYTKTQSDTNYPTFAYINTNYYNTTYVDNLYTVPTTTFTNLMTTNNFISQFIP